MPGYPALSIIARNLGCEMSYWKCRDTPNGAAFHLDDLADVIKTTTRLLIVNFPHNPTGFCPTAEEYRQLIAFCKERDIFLFSDEMYLLTDFGNEELMPSACTLYDDCISLFGMSKTLAQPGVRLGWLVTRNKMVLHKMNKCKDYFSQCCSATSEILSLISLRNMDAILQRNQLLIKKNLDILDDFFAGYADIFEWHRPKAATVCLVKIKGWLREEFLRGGASELCDLLYSEAGIVLLPGKIFDLDDAPDDTLRFGFGKSDLEECLKALRGFLENHRPLSAG
jgi:aspartate/methionine/tyrosine aminotransferase